MNETLKRLCELTAIQTQWLAVDGSTQQAKEETLLAILKILGIKTEDEATMQAEVLRIENSYWKKPLKDCYILRQYYDQPIGPVELTLAENLWEVEQNLDLHLEDGSHRQITFIPSQQKCLEWREINGRKMFRIHVYLPANLPWGYHQITTNFQSGPLRGTQKRVLIITPSSCYLPNNFFDRRYWGLGAHLYCLQGTGYYTNGDFADLSKAVELTHQAGADFFGINPLHALYPQKPLIASPYSPSSRSFLNPLYITTATMSQGSKADYPPSLWINWKQAKDERDAILRKKYEEFTKQDSQSDDKQSFAHWVGKDEQRNIHYALYNVISGHLEEFDIRKWPQEYASPESEASQRIGQDKVEEVAYQIWLQWMADSQLDTIGKMAKEKLAIGLYGDLAVGVTPFGADSWMSDVIVSDVVFGAPPDDFARMGQNWAICPFHPQKLRQEGFATFIHVIRENMRHFGALRIDHVMGLKQLYWIPQGMNATEGAYVQNPYEEFLGIIALESHRNQCMIIGEDLGTVPWGMREQMDGENMLGYRVFWFEKWAESGLFKRPDAYSYKALASISTHDLPTIASFWEGKDLAIRRQLKVYSSLAEQENLENKRYEEKQHLLAALKDQDLLAHDASVDNVVMDDLLKALHIFVARSNSQMMMVQLDDLSYEADPLNLPGVDEQVYPNWRRRLSFDLDEYMHSSKMGEIFTEIRKNRG